MNIVQKLTWRQMKLNRRRTLVTIIGVVISVAMITAVMTLGFSFQDMFKRSVIAEDGEWHVVYRGLDEKQVQQVWEDPESKKVLLSRDVGYSLLPGGQNGYKPYLFLKEYNRQALEEFPITLTKGRLPLNSSEVLIPEHVASNGGVQYQLGDTITLALGQRHAAGAPQEALGQNNPFLSGENRDSETEQLDVTDTRTVTVVGFIERPNWERSFSPGYTVITLMDESTISAAAPVTASVAMNHVNHSLYEYSGKLAKAMGISEEQVDYHNSLLNYCGVTQNDAMNSTMIGMISILIAIIMVGSVSLIYNAFAISVAERSRYLGMLSSVGATRSQKRNSVFFEGALIGAVSIPVGIICGLGGIGITFLFINPMLSSIFNDVSGLRVVISWGLLGLCVLFSALTIFISTWIPALRASKITPIDAIRQSQDVRLSRRKVKTSRLTRRLFGFEAELGLKNLKRNRRRYQATIISLAVSMVLFLTVSYYTQIIRSSYEAANSSGSYSFDITASLSSKNKDALQTSLNRILSTEGITEKSVQYQQRLEYQFQKEQIPEGILDSFAADPKGEYWASVYLIGLDDDSLAQYANTLGMDPDSLHDTQSPTGIAINSGTFRDAQNRFTQQETLLLQEGQKMPLFEERYLEEGAQESSRVSYGEITLEKVTDTPPQVSLVSPSPGMVYVFVSQDVYEAMALAHQDINALTACQVYLSSGDPAVLEDTIAKLELDDTSINLINLHEQRQSNMNLLTLVNVFTGGFLVLITLICAANIFNTISTSIALRRREFAMLRSVGMTPKRFNRMLRYESIFYGLKALLYGLPISFALMGLIWYSTRSSFAMDFQVPWIPLLVTVIAVFLMVGASMLYSSAKTRRETIVSGLTQENI